MSLDRTGSTILLAGSNANSSFTLGARQEANRGSSLN
ncbi:hypothetical protein BURMUCGD1_3082 [Burkholderia multivorans CGD1]|nr:hypothetical protein BURMUCGD1_3082 [Burkholderia multivorans CGD1]